MDSYDNESCTTCNELYSLQLWLNLLLTSSSSVVASGYFGHPTDKSDRHKVIEILLKVALNTNNFNICFKKDHSNALY